MRILIFLSILLFIRPTKAESPVYAFQIIISDSNTKVISPALSDQNFSVIIENRTSSRVLGKIKGKNVVRYTTISPSSFSSIEFKNEEKDGLVFIPLTPAFQEIPLAFGNKVYIVPEKK